MARHTGLAFACFCTVTLLAALSVAGSREKRQHQLSSPDTYVDVVGDVDGAHPAPQKVLADTVWIATWTFDDGPCAGPLPPGWMQGDNYIRTGNATGGNFVEPGATPTIHWSVDDAHSGQHLISGNAARLGYIDDCCAVNRSGGYAYGWYQGLRFSYESDGGPGVEEVTFDYLLDSEAGFDDLRVESDENCESFDRYDPDMTGSNIYLGQIGSDTFRRLRYEENGLNQAGTVTVELLDYGVGSHCFYIAFVSDGGFDPWDGELTPSISPAAALVVDNVVITDANGTTTEDFANGFGLGTPMNMHDAKPFNTLSQTGSFARTFPGITDNDACTWNHTCAILNTDNLTPTTDATGRFNAPGNFVMKRWLDDVIFTPWVTLGLGPANAHQTFVQFRRFPGNDLLTSWIVQNWSVRGGAHVDDGMGGTVPCTQNWGHVFQWNSLGTHRWITSTFDATNHFDPSSERIQIRFRQADWEFISHPGPPSGFDPGPGPHIDRIRIGRRVITGPALDEGIDARSQAQDAFATEIHPLVTPAGEHHRPLQTGTNTRFGTVAFSQGADLGTATDSPNLITGDSITMLVEDARNAGGITAVGVSGQIVWGPHAGMVPPPFAGSGWFTVNATPSMTSDGIAIEGNYFVDFDDDYFVGGDALHYLWWATDAQGGYAMNPAGLFAPPADIEEAQGATGGMYELSFLPRIVWNANYLADVAAMNKVDPRSNEALYINGSTQKNCVLYVNHHNSRRRSGDVNKTSFMHSLDELGYRDNYDIYDHSGMGNTNNHLGGRATVQHAYGYRVIIYDTGNAAPGRPLMPRGGGINPNFEKVDQGGWFQAWLTQGGTSEAGEASLWLLGSDLLDEHPALDLYATEMATSLVSSDQGIDVNPLSQAQPAAAAYQFQDGTVIDFTDGSEATYWLSGGCPTIEDYDGQRAVGTGVELYRFADPWGSDVGDASIVVNSNPTEGFNTIFMSHAWSDIYEEMESPPANGSCLSLMDHFLTAVLGDCRVDPWPSSIGEPQPRVSMPPLRTVLGPNYPNPFNPSTTIRFDLAESGHVSLRIYDAAGHLVRTLVDGSLTAGHDIQRRWDGTDSKGRGSSSGIYFYRLETPGYTSTRKMVLLR